MPSRDAAKALRVWPLTEAEKEYHRRMAGLRFSTDRAVSLIRLERIIERLSK